MGSGSRFRKSRTCCNTGPQECIMRGSRFAASLFDVSSRRTSTPSAFFVQMVIFTTFASPQTQRPNPSSYFTSQSSNPCPVLFAHSFPALFATRQGSVTGSGTGCRGAGKTGEGCASKTGIMRETRWFSLRGRVAEAQSVLASAEDRALRGRNPSAARSLLNGQSGGHTAARLALAGSSFKALNPPSC